MVQCDEYGAYEQQKFNGGEWKRIGYSKMPLECVAIHPLTHELIGIKKYQEMAFLGLLVTFERDISNKNLLVFFLPQKSPYDSVM